MIYQVLQLKYHQSSATIVKKTAVKQEDLKKDFSKQL